MSSNDPHHHHYYSKTTHHVFDKLSNRISAIKEDITEAVKERSRSFSSDRKTSILSTTILTNVNSVAFSSNDDTQSMIIKTEKSFKTSGTTGSLSSLGSTSSSLASSSSSRQTIDQLSTNKGFNGLQSCNSTSSNLSTATTTSLTSLINSPSNVPSLIITSSNSREKFNGIEDISTPRITNSIDQIGAVQERLRTKIDPVDMIGKPTVVLVPKNTIKQSPILLSGPKFRFNSKQIPKEKFLSNNDPIYSLSILVGIISLIITLWKPISSFFSGFFVGCLFAIVIVYVCIRMFIHTKIEETTIEEWIDFPAVDSMLAKIDKEDKNTNIQVSGASMSFQSYDADRDDDFVRYPCDIRLDGYRLIIQLATKPWSDEKKTDKEVKFIGCREYLVKEARMILVPEATLTRAKYWMNEYPIVIQDLQILDKQIYNKQQLEKSKLHTNNFFTNMATVISIWFETGLQKEEWFHKLSLVLRRGREDIRRVNNLFASSSSLNRRQAQGENDIEPISHSLSEANIRASTIETQINVEELKQKFKKKVSENIVKDASRTIVRKSKDLTANEINLEKILQTPECLDEAAIKINFLTRRLLCDMFSIPLFKDLLKTKIEMKLKEIAVSILENLRVISIDLGNTFPIILKIEPMQWNTQGIWFNLFLYYRGNFKFSVRTRVVLQKLINYDPKKDKPIFAQDHSTQIVHKDDLIQRQKLLAKEPEIAEMVVTRKLGTALTNLALNKYFQFFANLPFVKRLVEKFSEREVGVDVEMTSFSGILTLNIPPPPSDRIWVGFSEMPDLNIKVIPTYGEKQYSYVLLQDLLSAKIRAELKRLVVLPAMDDQLLPFFRDWAIDVIGEIVSKPVNPEIDDYKTKINIQNNIREGLQEYKNLHRQSSKTSIHSETNIAQT